MVSPKLLLPRIRFAHTALAPAARPVCGRKVPCNSPASAVSVDCGARGGSGVKTGNRGRGIPHRFGFCLSVILLTFIPFPWQRPYEINSMQGLD